MSTKQAAGKAGIRTEDGRERGRSHLGTGVSSVGKETAGAWNVHQKDTKMKEGSGGRKEDVSGGETENEGKKRRRWENRAEEAVTKYLWTRQTMGHPEYPHDPQDQGSRTSKAPGRQKNGSLHNTFRSQQEATDIMWRKSDQDDGKSPF